MKLNRCNMCKENNVDEEYQCPYMFLFGCLQRLRLIDRTKREVIRVIEEEVKKRIRKED